MTNSIRQALPLEKAQKIVNSIDLTKVSALMKQHKKWDDERIASAELWYRRFLMLHLVEVEEDILTTQDVDDYWHMHIIDTENYINDCHVIFGCYFHHHPVVIDESEVLAFYGNAFRESRELFRGHFGEIPPFKHINSVNHPLLSKEQQICMGGNCGGKCGNPGVRQGSNEPMPTSLNA